MTKRKAAQLDEIENEGSDEGEETGRASFTIHNGKEEIRVQALKDCWALQKWITAEDGAKTASRWKSFKYITDLGSVANRIFEMRLKNAEVTTLQELSVASKQIGVDIRREFSLQGCACKA
jgi:hypothetical protein